MALKTTLDTIIESENGKFKCSVCGKISRCPAHAKEHGEIHIKGLSYTCFECDKHFSTTASLRHCSKLVKTRWVRAVPSSGQVWFAMVLTDLWVLNLAFQSTQTALPNFVLNILF